MIHLPSYAVWVFFEIEKIQYSPWRDREEGEQPQAQEADIAWCQNLSVFLRRGHGCIRGRVLLGTGEGGPWLRLEETQDTRDHATLVCAPVVQGTGGLILVQGPWAAVLLERWRIKR